MIGGGGSDAPSAPEPTQEERALQQAQADLLKKQTEIANSTFQLQQTMLPLILKESGFEAVKDANGKIIDFKESSDPESVKRRELNNVLLDRSLAAAKGELPVDPAVERELTTQQGQVRDTLRNQLGTGFETSSAGIETLSKLNESQTVIREGARRGDLTLAEQLGLARNQQNTNNMANAGNFAVGAPMQIGKLFGDIATGTGNAQQPFIQQRALETQANIAASNQATQQNIAQQQQIGQLGGLFASLLFCDRRYKTDITETGIELIPGVELYQFRFRDDPEGMKRIGPMAQDVQKVMPEAVLEDEDGKLWIRWDMVSMPDAEPRTLEETLGRFAHGRVR